MPNTNTKNNTMNLQIASEQIRRYMSALQESFLFREEEIKILMVSLIIGKNACFIGSHGEAKSALIEQFAKGIDKKFFGCQFNRFSTPDEILGHFSLAEMKNNDQYIRKYKNKLPDAQIAYLDECFNASGAMLQSLQKALNEKRIDLGNGTELSIPMELAIASTNFHCSKNPELAAFWDRFFLRIETKNTVSQMNLDTYKKFMKLKRSGKLGKITKTLSNTVIEYIRSQMDSVSIPNDIDHKIYTLLDLCNKNGIHLSARRLVWIEEAIKAMALLEGSRVVEQDDLKILQHCLWVHIEQYDMIESFITKVTKSPLTDAKNYLKSLKALKIKYLRLDSNMSTEKSREGRISLLKEMESIEEAMISIVDTVNHKLWPDGNPELESILDDILKYKNPTKFLV